MPERILILQEYLRSVVKASDLHILLHGADAFREITVLCHGCNLTLLRKTASRACEVSPVLGTGTLQTARVDKEQDCEQWGNCTILSTRGMHLASRLVLLDGVELFVKAGDNLEAKSENT